MPDITMCATGDGPVRDDMIERAKLALKEIGESILDEIEMERDDGEIWSDERIRDAQVRAVIEAMRHVTVDMSAVGQAVIDKGDAAFPSDAVWQVMIDAALAPPPKADPT